MPRGGAGVPRPGPGAARTGRPRPCCWWRRPRRPATSPWCCAPRPRWARPPGALDAAESAGLLRVDAHRGRAFRHPLVRTAVYRGATFWQAPAGAGEGALADGLDRRGGPGPARLAPGGGRPGPGRVGGGGVVPVGRPGAATGRSRRRGVGLNERSATLAPRPATCVPHGWPTRPTPPGRPAPPTGPGPCSTGPARWPGNRCYGPGWSTCAARSEAACGHAVDRVRRPARPAPNRSRRSHRTSPPGC